jgi:hypothetical protein
MTNFSKIMAYLLAMLLGVYATKQWIYHQPIEGFRWVTTFILFGIFHLKSIKEKE